MTQKANCKTVKKRKLASTFAPPQSDLRTFISAKIDSSTLFTLFNFCLFIYSYITFLYAENQLKDNELFYYMKMKIIYVFWA